MSDATFPFRPILKQSDRLYIENVTRRGEALQVAGLDGSDQQHGYYISTREYGVGTPNVVLGVLFERLTADDAIIFVYKPDGQNWRWLSGYTYHEADSEVMYRELERVTAEEETIQWQKEGEWLAARQRTLEAKKAL